MVTPELIEFIKKQLQMGKTEEELKSLLVGKGWPGKDVEEAFKAVVVPSVSEASPFSRPIQSVPVQPSQPVRPIQPIGKTVRAFEKDMDNVFSEEETNQIYSRPSSKKKSFKKILVFFAVFAGLAFLVGGGFAAYSYFVQSPEKILAKSMVKSSEIKSAKYSGAIDFSVQATGNASQTSLPFSAGMNLDFSMNFNGGSDFSIPDNPRSFLNLSLINKSQSDSDIKEFAGMEIRYLGKVAYVVLNQIPETIPGFSSLKGQWFKIDPQEIKEMAKDMNLTEDQLVQLDKSLSSQALTQEKNDAVRKLFKDSKILKITDKLANEKIDSQNTHHYRYIIEKDSLKKFIVDVSKIMEIEMPADVQAELDKAMDEYQDITGEIWIGKKDLLVHKLTAKMVMEINEQSGKVAIQINILVLENDFNKPVTIEAPVTFQSFADLIKGYLGLFTNQIDCSTVPVVADRDDCYIQEAKSKKDEEICKLIVNRSWKDECYRAVAEAKLDSALCRMIYSANWKNYCLAGALQDASYCQLIKINSTKQACLEKLK